MRALKKAGKITSLAILTIVLLLNLPALFYMKGVLSHIVGSVFMLCVCSLLIARLALPGFFKKLKNGRHSRIPYRILAWLLAAGFAYAGLVAVFMASAAFRAPVPGGDFTVVVLGCQVRGSVPSESLRRRLDIARDILNEHPQAMCIVSGGQGEGEDMPEAEAMKEYLIKKGVSRDRILMEGESSDTRENMSYSASIIAAGGLSRNVIIVTDGYHQYRASRYAEKNGLVPSAASAATLWWLFGAYASREMLANGFYVIFGYE